MNNYHVKKWKYDYEIYHSNFNGTILKDAGVF